MNRNSVTTTLALAICMLVTSAAVQATQPPRPGELQHLKAQGKLEERRARVEQLGNHIASPDLVRKYKESLQKMGLATEDDFSDAATGTVKSLPPAKAGRGLPPTGDLKTFTLLIEFDGYPHTFDTSYVDSIHYGDGVPQQYPRESLANYYSRASYGLADMSNGTTFAWFTSSYDRSSLEWGDSDDVIQEAITHFDTLGHDFSQYDNDGDGDIDYFIVIWTGPNTGWMTFWWAYRTAWPSDNSFQVDGKDLGYYSWQWESDSPTIVIHETGHGFGLPDLYDYDSDVGLDGGVGGFDMMHANTYDHNCFSKWMLGWLEPTVVATASQSLTLDDTASSPECVLIWPGATVDDIFSEFFLVQNRQNVGNDETGFSPDGLAIWHIDSTLESTGWTFLYNNSYTDRKLVRLMEADGLEDIESYGGADADDLYGNGDEIGPDTTPSSEKYNGFDSCVSVWNIVDNGVAAGSTISATFNFTCDCQTTPATPDLITPADGQQDMATTPTLNWTWSSGSESYPVQVCKDVDCLDVSRNVLVTANYWNVTPALEDGVDYFWRVRSNGDCDASEWSEARSFSTICEEPPLSAPVLSYPPDGEVDVDLDGPLRWDDVPDAEIYLVIVCSDADCTSVIRSVNVPPTDSPLYTNNVWFVEPELAGATEYWWQVKARTLCSFSEWSERRSFTTVPVTGVPVLLEPHDDEANISLQPTLKWQAVTGAYSYEVQVCNHLNYSCDDVLRSGTPNTTEWTVGPNPLYEERTYPWRVRATGPWGTSEWSQRWEFHTCNSVGTPLGTSFSPPNYATDLPLTPTLNWDPKEGATSYDVEVCSDSTCSLIVRSATTYYSHWTVEPGLDLLTQYWWRLRSNNACGPSQWTAYPPNFTTSSCPTPPDKPYPKAPSFGEYDVSVTPTLNWEDYTSMNLHPSEVEVCSGAGCDTIVRAVVLTLADEWQVAPALDTATQYWWRVRYLAACGPGPWSNVTTFTTEDCANPDAPNMLEPGTSVASGASYTVEWTPNPHAISYTVQESTRADFYKATSQSTSSSSLTFSHLNAECTEKTYHYRVKAATDCSIGAWSTAVDMIVESPETPAAPTGLAPPRDATDQSPTLTLDWDDVADVQDYEVRVCSDADCRTVVRTATPRNSNWTVTPALDEYTPYAWQVRAGNDCGDGPWSAINTFMTGCAVPDTPVVTDPGTHIGSGASYTVSWAEVADATEYQVQEDVSPSFGRPTTFIATKTSVGFSHINNGCDTDTYYYRVVAVGACGLSDISATVDMAVDGSGSLSAPALALPADDAIGEDTDVLLDWDQVSGADAYDVQVCLDRSCLTAVRGSTETDHEWTVAPALGEYTLHTWKVRATNNCLDGPWSEVREFETGCNLPAVPRVLDPGVSAASRQSYVVSWSAVADVTGYTLYEATNPSFLNSTSYLLSQTETSMTFGHSNGTCASVTYFYRVVAHNACGTGEVSQTVDMVVTGLLGGDPCSTGLDGVCSAGITQCVRDELVCLQTTHPTADLCDGLDNDCNPITADGFAELWFGAACDGVDGDLCEEGVLTCVHATRSCTDRSDTTAEICGDGIDNDCDGVVDCLGDPFFADGFETGDASMWTSAVN